MKISTHTLRGERDEVGALPNPYAIISTHTLHGERDIGLHQRLKKIKKISTHTLREERDYQ